jgi:hypothetical protein
MPTRQFPGLSFEALLSNRVVKELRGTKRATDALRIALVHAIVLLQEDESPEARNFCRYLLLDFPPLANAFKEHKHPYFEAVEVMRHETADGAVTLALPVERVAAALGLPVPDDLDSDDE